MDIILIANSPGELSALVSPIAAKFKEKNKAASIYLFLTPCQYTSGKEIEFARKNLPVDQIISADEYKKWMLGGKLPHAFDFKGVCVYLGGDLLHATLIAKRLNYPLYAYISGKFISWARAFRRFYLPDLNMFNYFSAKGIPKEKLKISGDLMVDSSYALPRTAVREKWKLDLSHPTVAFLPGSRKWEIRHMLPLYEKTGRFLKNLVPNVKLMLIVSPFISLEEITEYKGHHIFDVFAAQDSVSAADLAVTIPGTNTAVLAAQGLPMILVFPLDNPEVIPMEGIMHYISLLPGLKFAIKKLFLWQVNRRTKYFALPNIKSNHDIVEEIRGKVDPRQVAEKASDLLRDKEKLKWISIALKNAMGPKGAADLIVEEILNESL